MNPDMTPQEFSWCLFAVAFFVGTSSATLLILTVQWGELPLMRQCMGGEWWHIARDDGKRLWTNDREVAMHCVVIGYEDRRP